MGDHDLGEPHDAHAAQSALASTAMPAQIDAAQSALASTSASADLGNLNFSCAGQDRGCHATTTARAAASACTSATAASPTGSAASASTASDRTHATQKDCGHYGGQPEKTGYCSAARTRSNYQNGGCAGSLGSSGRSYPAGRTSAYKFSIINYDQERNASSAT